MPDLHELHNQLAGEIVKSIVKPPLEAGGTFADVYALLESVIVGVMLVDGGNEDVFDELMRMAKERMLTLRTRIHQ